MAFKDKQKLLDYNRRWRLKNRDKIRATDRTKSKNRYQSNKSVILSRQKVYYRKNRTQILERQRLYNQKNRARNVARANKWNQSEKGREAMRLYRIKNRERLIAYRKTRYVMTKVETRRRNDAWRTANKKRSNELNARSARLRYSINPHRFILIQKRYATRHPEKVRLKFKKYWDQKQQERAYFRSLGVHRGLNSIFKLNEHNPN